MIMTNGNFDTEIPADFLSPRSVMMMIGKTDSRGGFRGGFSRGRPLGFSGALHSLRTVAGTLRLSTTGARRGLPQPDK